MEYLVYYVVMVLLMVSINSIMSGFTGRDLEFKDFTDSLIWPITILVLIGVLIRIIYNKIKGKK